MISQTSRVAVVLSSLMLALGGLAGCSSSPSDTGNSGGTGSSSGGTSGSSSGSKSGGSSSGNSSGSSSSGGGSNAAVSFAADVAPIFQMNCSAGGATCHGDTSVSSNQSLGNRQYLGPAPGSGTYTSAVITQVLGDILNVKSFEDLTMNVVTPGDATKSFLMYKMDGTQDMLDAQCTTGKLQPACGLLMPWASATVLPQAQRDTVRSWINQGAKNN
ncbi:MAG: hypothetical protein WBY94_16340 [Polyangiaceae bacterium]